MTFEEDLDRGHLPTGEPLEAKYGAGWWTHQSEAGSYPDIVECHVCGGRAWDLGTTIDCENCGVIATKGEGND
jgi:hypothetical protein